MINWVIECRINRGGIEPSKTPTYGAPTQGENYSISTFNRDGFADIYARDTRTFLWGRLVYEDVLGKRRVLGFGRSTIGNALRSEEQTDWLHWGRYGGDDYNYDHEEPAQDST